MHARASPHWSSRVDFFSWNGSIPQSTSCAHRRMLNMPKMSIVIVPTANLQHAQSIGTYDPIQRLALPLHGWKTHPHPTCNVHRFSTLSGLLHNLPSSGVWARVWLGLGCDCGLHVNETVRVSRHALEDFVQFPQFFFAGLCIDELRLQQV